MKSLAPMDDDDVDRVLEPIHATTALSTHAEASKMLETALQQMDGIIAGTQQLDLRKASIGSNPRPTSLQEALNQLQSTIKLVGADKRYVYNWVLNLIEMPEVEERLQRLEGDKDSLQMQISILMDQIEMQTEKINDLEKTLMDKNAQLKRSEEIIQSEVLSRSSAETHQLELLSEMSSIKLRYAALEKENCELRSQLKRSEQDMVALVSQCYSVCGATLGPSMNRQDLVETLQLNLRNATSGSPLRVNPNTNKALAPATSALSLQSNQSQLQGSSTHTSKTPPANVFRKIETEPFNSLPRHNSSTMSPLLSPPPIGPSPKRAVVFAETEKAAAASTILPEQEDVAGDSMSPSSPHSPSLNSFSKQPRGLKKIFDKLKRNNSGALEGDPSSPLTTGDDFRRGGLRSTAGPRLGWNGNSSSIDRSSPKPTRESELPFSQWSVDEITGWFHDMGLQLYVNDIQRWMPSSKQLLTVSASELEKELMIKNPLHKKKIILALEAKGRQQDPMSPIPILPELLSSSGKLDHQWTVRWLDDIGLPQYKDTFLESRVDGRMLHLLTVDDLCSHLKVTNLLHLICIRRGIQVLRLNEYNATCLQRRSVPDDPANPTPNQVAVWTNHRVMEWLRAVDLSEYAPNMRGSGVHGGLLVYEPRFTAELLATLLSIPQSKTLLRRHLATHFNQLLGREIVQAKRDMETSPTHPPLNPVSKVKILKKSQFTLKRRKGKPDEFDPEDWICPDYETHDFSSDKNPCRKDQATKSTDL